MYFVEQIKFNLVECGKGILYLYAQITMTTKEQVLQNCTVEGTVVKVVGDFENEFVNFKQNLI